MANHSKDGKMVRYLNPLNFASYKLDLFELRVVMAAIASVKPDEEIRPSETYYVSAEDVMMLGTRKQEVYAALSKASQTLFHSSATISMSALDAFPSLRSGFRTQYEAYKKHPDKKNYVQFHFLAALSYGDGKIGFNFTEQFIPFIQQLKERFTEFELVDLKGLKSVYAVRIYTMALQYQNHPKRTFITTVEELRKALNLGSAYRLFGNFKQRILDVAVRQINASPYTKFGLELEIEKGEHNRVTRLIFHLQPKPYSVLPSGKPAKHEEGAAHAKAQTVLTEAQATLSVRQIPMYADWLAGRNAKKVEATGFNAHAFFEWLKAQNMNPKGSSSEEFADWLRSELASPSFVQKIYNPWLKQLGFRSRRRSRS
ncbi:replication initiation protein [Mesosutterella sp. AGMB02718]|uniref:Replication initiation protein n=1 Tax=Mesosutterella faecium TaxID=2925194 RepID=A0ABT7IQ53_9BURK|nr:replication initiation protein [Mesosutterella sp. AGMB02718]MDL2060520.1 replication initiation protein [Mesosutterella sp. AGMB02718]